MKQCIPIASEDEWNGMPEITEESSEKTCRVIELGIIGKEKHSRHSPDECVLRAVSVVHGL